MTEQDNGYHPHEITDEELAGRVTLDSVSFALLYDRYFRKIYAYFMRWLGNSDKAETLTSDTFFKALQAMHAGKYKNEPGKFEGWLFTIAHNRYANYCRESGRRRDRETNLEPLIDFLEARQSDDPERIALTNEEREALMIAVRELDSRRQVLLHFRFVQRLKLPELGLVMGTTEGAVKALLHRTMVVLRKKMKSHK